MKLSDLPRNKHGIPVFDSADYGRSGPARCPEHNAIRFRTEQDASAAQHQTGGHHIYHCRRCGDWHVAPRGHDRGKTAPWQR